MASHDKYALQIFIGLICHHHDTPTRTDLIDLREDAFNVVVILTMLCFMKNAKHDDDYLEADVEKKEDGNSSGMVQNVSR